MTFDRRLANVTDPVVRGLYCLSTQNLIQRKCDTVQNAPCSFKQSSSIRNVFHFFLVKSAMQNYFHNVQVSCYCCVTWHETRTIFSLLYSHRRWSFRGVMLLHVSMVREGSFAVLVLLHSSKLAFGRGHTIKQLPGARALQDLCTPLN